ncbi:MAG: dipeptidyl-peptidase 3 family protein [Mangrovibacterium sp.]
MPVFLERFADIKILRYNLPGFDQLDLKQKLYIYHLSQAALCGRDILFDQNNAHNLSIRTLLESIYQSYTGDRNTPVFQNFVVYLKHVWFANGIHHHYSMEKFQPNFSEADFDDLLSKSSYENEQIDLLKSVIFNPEVQAKRVSLDSSGDLLHDSAMNYYQGVSQQDAEEFYTSQRESYGDNAPSFGLNSTLTHKNGQLTEETWSANGKYTNPIRAIIEHLNEARKFTENKQQAKTIELLVQYYETGDLKLFDDYSIAWSQENEGMVDFVNGFIEVYGDPLGIKGSWESIVNYKDVVATKRAQILSENANWFEQHSPTDAKFKKTEVKGVSAKVIHVAMLGGDCYPATPIGINLPNSEWIREQYGSKSVTIENITQAYFADALGNGMIEEFAASTTEIERAQNFGELASNLHTDLHECLGHGSGKMMPGVKPEDLKNYYSTIEETRADLFALYYIADPKLLELGLVPSMETGKAEYDSYMRNGLLTQLTRIELGKDLEESHMRNRQLIARWAYEHGTPHGVIELIKHDGKTFVQINDYNQLRALFGELLHEIQRVKSEGDYEGAKHLVETYGVRIDRELHREILTRFQALNVAPYAGFVNNEFELICNESGEPIDVKVVSADSYTEQMLKYSKKYGFEID